VLPDVVRIIIEGWTGARSGVAVVEIEKGIPRSVGHIVELSCDDTTASVGIVRRRVWMRYYTHDELDRDLDGHLGGGAGGEQKADEQQGAGQ
jgi:hypothetical protein